MPGDAGPLALRGKSALVCGATRGIGRACAREFARLGARVTLMARGEERLREALDELNAKGAGEVPAHHDYLAADFDDPASVQRVVSLRLERGAGFQILLNNTGGPQGGPILDAEPGAFIKAFTSHLVCNHVLARLVAPGMKQSGYGRIINIVSTSVKQPIAGLGVSNTVRAAVASWAKTLSVELAPFGITVNNVLPGATRTDRLLQIIRERATASGRSEKDVEDAMKREIPAGRFAEAEEIAAAAGFLALPSTGYVTGVSLAVDGGRTTAL